MKKFLLSLFITLSFISQGDVFAQYTRIESSITSGSFYKTVFFLPPGYNPANPYPLIISFHGNGEAGGAGSDITKLYNNGLPKALKDGYIPTEDFIVVAPQDGWGGVNAANVPGILSNIKSRYLIDTNRIYITGYSAGAATTIAATMNISPAFLKNFAAIIPFSPASENTTNGSWFIGSGVAGVWCVAGLNSGADNGYSANAAATANHINANVPGLAKLTQASGLGHGGSFLTLYNGSYNDGGVTFWSYIAGKTRNGAVSNIPPIAAAGADKVITLPTNSTTLIGSGTDADGTISTYAWTKLSGSGSISNPSSSTTNITGLTAGVSVFRLTVTDNGGLTGYDDVTVTTNSGGGNTSPIANAGSPQTITLPTSSVTLAGSGVDADGTISTYAWSKISGTGSTITSPSSATTTVTGLTAGSYTFRLTVTDNGGATGTSDVLITVNAAGAIVNKTFNIDFGYATQSGNWNNMVSETAGSSLSLIDTTGGASSASIQITSAFAGTTSAGTTSSALYPANASKDASILGVSVITKDTATLQVTGLNSTSTYVFRFYASRMAGDAGNRNTRYAIGGSSVILNATDNVNGTVELTVVNPVSGTVDITVNRESGAAFGYLGVLKISENAGGSNASPTASAGVDKSITSPTSSVSVTGSGTDSDGSISSYLWSKISGPAGATITTPASATTTITGLVVGNYTYRLTVTDNGGATGTDDMFITVLAAGNQAPTVNAGTDQSISLPTSSTTLTAVGSDVDGTISTYAWSKISGSGTIGSAASASTSISGLTAGVSTFRVTVTDNNGATAYDEISITVNVAPVSGTLVDIATGEYSMGWVKSDGTVWTPYESSYNVTTTNTQVAGLSNIVEADGGQYTSVYRSATGQVYDKFKNGITSTAYPLDYLGNAFTADKIYAMWRQILALKNGEVYYWSAQDESGNYEDMLQQFGSMTTRVPTPRKLIQPPSKTIVKLVHGSSISPYAGAKLWGLASDGTVWAWTTGVTTPVQITKKLDPACTTCAASPTWTGTVVDIAMIGPSANIVVTSTNEVWTWGYASHIVGGRDNWQNQPMDNITSSLLSAGIVFPLKQITGNYLAGYIIDANNNLFTIGTNQSGALGNGYQVPSFRTHYNGTSSHVYSFDFNIDHNLQTNWGQIPGKWQKIKTNTTFVWYAYGQDMKGKWLSWGRNKGKSLGNGKTWGNQDQADYAEYLNIPAPRYVDPLTNLTWVYSPTDGNLNPATARTPIANAGINQYLDMGVNTAVLYGTGSHQQQPTNSLTVTMTNVWTKVSGPNTPTIEDATSPVANVSGLITGTYVFRNTVTNSVGATDFQDVTIEVSESAAPSIRYFLIRKVL